MKIIPQAAGRACVMGMRNNSLYAFFMRNF